jgi:hypothetical protein
MGSAAAVSRSFACGDKNLPQRGNEARIQAW